MPQASISWAKCGAHLKESSLVFPERLLPEHGPRVASMGLLTAGSKDGVREHRHKPSEHFYTSFSRHLKASHAGSSTDEILHSG